MISDADPLSLSVSQASGEIEQAATDSLRVDDIAPDAPPTKARSALMAKVRGKDTKPELVVRRALHALGFRFRLHRRDLPGRPDVVLPRHRLAIFVHGCFWHRHPGCRMASNPKTRREFWEAKFDANVERDRRNMSALRDLGWRVGIVWECETRKPSLADELVEMLAASEAHDKTAIVEAGVSSRSDQPSR